MFSPCCYSEIHFDIEKGNFNFLQVNIKETPEYEFRYTYIFWKALEFAKFKLNIAKKFKPAAIDNAFRIYFLIRDYTLFHAINTGNLRRVRTIINHHSERLNLHIKLKSEHTFISLLELAKRAKDRSLINGVEIYAIVINFLGPNFNMSSKLDL